MFKNNILRLVLLLSPLAAFAQNLDPTVEVSRTYKSTLMEVHKPMFGMHVPDSVMHFDLDFDYSVFDSPYKGTYEFTPYMPDMKPQPDAWSGRRFFLRAGAGYPVHPVFDLVWSPDFQGKFRMSVYATHRSFFGGYRNVSHMITGAHPEGVFGTSSAFIIGGPRRIGWKGYDMLSKAGVNGRTDWDKGAFTFDVGYYGLATKDSLLRRGYDGVDANFRVYSVSDSQRHFIYDVALDYRYGEDKLNYAAVEGRKYLTEHNISLDAVLGQAFSAVHQFQVGINADLAAYGALYAGSAGRFAIIPKYLFRNGRWDIEAGVAVSMLFNGASESYMPEQQFTKGQIVYPDVRVGFEVVKDYLQLYVKAGGGDAVGRYSDLTDYSHFLNPASVIGPMPLMDNTVERISAAFGLRGNISSKFTYDLSAGYRNFANSPLFALLSENGDVTKCSSAVLSYADYRQFYVSAYLGWKSDDFTFDGTLKYAKSQLPGDVAVPVATVPMHLSYVSPASFSGTVSALYNWHKRIYAGIDCDFAVGRKSSLASLADYADLGVYLEYKAASLFSLWIRGGNLLDMTVQRMPFYAESGISVTAGICLSL